MKITLIDNSSNKLCKCVGKHIPKSRRVYRIDYSGGHIFVCPTALANLHALEVEYAKYEGNPPGSVRKHFSQFTRDLYRLLSP